MNYKSILKNLMEQGRTYTNQVVIGLALVLGFLIGLGTGLLVNDNKSSPILIDKNVRIGLPTIAEHIINKPSNPIGGTGYVASTNGNSYYPVNCKAAEKIKEENKIWFKSVQEAKTQGYKLAQNCR